MRTDVNVFERINKFSRILTQSTLSALANEGQKSLHSFICQQKKFIFFSGLFRFFLIKLVCIPI